MLIISGFLVGVVFFTLSGCTTPGEVEETTEAQEVQKVPETEMEKAVSQTEVAQEVKVVETTEVAEKAEEVRESKDTKTVLRVNCGAYEPYTDKAGNIWLADQDMGTDKKWGAIGGDTVDRDDLGITDTNSPVVYETERYGMDGYKFSVPNGNYTIRLHFAETYSDIYGVGDRVFSVTINEKPVIEDFDPFKEAGGLNKPVVKTIEGVTVTNGELVIGFVFGIQNPEINGIEIISE